MRGIVGANSLLIRVMEPSAIAAELKTVSVTLSVVLVPSFMKKMPPAKL